MSIESEALYHELLGREIGQLLLRHYPPQSLDYEKLLCDRSLQIIAEIQAVLFAYDDNDFATVEAIVLIFEKYGLRTAHCHD